MCKHNHFVIFLKRINLSINNQLEKYLNKFNDINLLDITKSNKVLLIFVASIILFLSYLSIPHIYDKLEVRKELENQIFNRFNLNLTLNKDFNYKFYPRPHFIIKESFLLVDGKKISNIKDTRIFVSLSNLFSLKDIIIKDIIVENTNFNLDKNSSSFFLKILDNNFLESNFVIKNSNIFFKNSEKKVMFINKIKNMKYYYDAKELKNIAFSESEIFNIPYSILFHKDKNKKIFTKINLDFLKFQIQNSFDYSNNLKKGKAHILYDKKKSILNYEFDKVNFVFNYFDKPDKTKFIYKGNIDFNPFFSEVNGLTKKINLTNLFNPDLFITQILKTEILNHKNLNINFKINADQVEHYESFIDFLFNFKIKEGLIDIDNTEFSWKNFVNFEISNSLIYVNKNQLILNAKLLIDIKNYNELYKYLQMTKNLRPDLKKIEFNFEYNFDQQIVDISSIKVDGQNTKKIDKVLKKIILKKNKLQNKIHFKNIIKEAISVYAG